MFVDIVGYVATIITIGSFLTGTQICRAIYKRGHTEDISSFPFFAGTLCTFLWLRYGFILGDSTMIFVNSTGFLIQSSYLVFFFIFALQKSPMIRRLVILVTLLFGVHTYAIITSDPGALIGLLASGSSLLFCASPLASVRQVFATRSTESLPFALIVSSFLVSMLWLLYGTLIQNSFVQFPNACGAMISGLQISLFFIFPSKSKSQYHDREDKKELLKELIRDEEQNYELQHRYPKNMIRHQSLDVLIEPSYS